MALATLTMKKVMEYNIMKSKSDPKVLAKLLKISENLKKSNEERDLNGYQVPSLAHLAVRTLDPKDVPEELKEVANRARKAGRRTKRRKKITK